MNSNCATPLLDEEWRDIEGYEGYYQVSSLGRVRSVKRVVLKSDGIWMNCKSTILRPFIGTTANYLETQLSKDNIPKKFLIHRLVAYAFLGLTPNSSLEVNHKDGNRHNNAVQNLEVVTHQENINHSIRTKLKNDYGELHKRAVLTNAQAAEIRQKWRDGSKQVDLANYYGVSKQTICSVVHNKTYIK